MGQHLCRSGLARFTLLKTGPLQTLPRAIPTPAKLECTRVGLGISGQTGKNIY